MRDPGYTYEEDKPGLCFGFHILKHSDSRYEVSLMFNDQMKADPYGSGIPRQTNPSWDLIDPVANIPAFEKYNKDGYAIL